MTKEDAGQILNTFIDCLYTNLTEGRYWELKDAVKALQEQELKDLPSAESEQKTWKKCLICGAKIEVDEDGNVV